MFKKLYINQISDHVDIVCQTVTISENVLAHK